MSVFLTLLSLWLRIHAETQGGSRRGKDMSWEGCEVNETHPTVGRSKGEAVFVFSEMYWNLMAENRINLKRGGCNLQTWLNVINLFDWAPNFVFYIFAKCRTLWKKHCCLRPMMPLWIIFMTLKASAAFLRLATPPQTKFKIVSWLSLLHLYQSQLAPCIHLIKHKIFPLMENLDIVSNEVFPLLVV